MTWLGLLFVAAFGVAADAARSATVDVSGRGVLRFDVPASWSSMVRGGEIGMPTLVVRAPERAVEVLVTPLAPEERRRDLDAGNVDEWVKGAAEMVAPTAVENPLPMRRLEHVKGSYFWATDRAPKPGEFEYMCQGAVAVRDVLITFTILTHEAPPRGIEKGLGVIESLRLDDSTK